MPRGGVGDSDENVMSRERIAPSDLYIGDCNGLVLQSQTLKATRQRAPDVSPPCQHDAEFPNSTRARSLAIEQQERLTGSHSPFSSLARPGTAD